MDMRWPWSRAENRSATISISDPAFAEYFGLGTSYGGVTVSEESILGIPAVYRAVSLIAQTIASLKVGAVEKRDDGTRERVKSWVDDPAANTGMTPFEFWETVMMHLLIHGNAYLIHVYNGAGAIVGLHPIHPSCVTVELERDEWIKSYRVALGHGLTRIYTDLDLLHIVGPSTDGIRGLPLVHLARNSFSTAIAGDRAAARMFGNGGIQAGIVTPEEDITSDEAETIKRSLQAKVAGWDNAGEIAVINRKLKFTPWTMSAGDAQFLESRQFQIEEIARWFGIPPHMLMHNDGTSNWGTGVAEQNRGLSRTVLGPWARRLEDRISKLLPRGRELEFDFAALERPTPEQEITLLKEQVAAGIITVNEARAIRNLPPHPEGDVLYRPSGSVGEAGETPGGGTDVPPGGPVDETERVAA